MPRVPVLDLSALLDMLTPRPLLRRRRPAVEGQSARCPRCNRVMVVRMGKRMPEYHCGCTAAPATLH